MTRKNIVPHRPHLRVVDIETQVAELNRSAEDYESTLSMQQRSSSRARNSWLFASILCIMSHSASVHAADPPQREKATRYRKAVAREGIEAGCARIVVIAPVSTVLQVTNDFDQYARFIKRFKDGRLQLQVRARVVAHSGDRPDVYLEVPIMKGAAKVWGILRFEPFKKVDSEDVREGHLVKGNVARLDARWRVRKLDEARTELSLELLIVPSVPVPHSLVTGEVEFVSDVAVSGVRDESEQRASR